MMITKDCENTYQPLHRVETLDFQNARERSLKRRKIRLIQRLLGAALIVIGVITIPLCGDITPFIFMLLFSLSVLLP